MISFEKPGKNIIIMRHEAVVKEKKVYVYELPSQELSSGAEGG